MDDAKFAPGDILMDVRAADLIAAYQLLGEAHGYLEALAGKPPQWVSEADALRGARAFLKASIARLLTMQTGPVRVAP